MAAIFTLRKGSSDASPSLSEGELYLHLGSGSIQFGSGSTKYNLLPLDTPITGNIDLLGNISASGDVRIGGNIYLGNASADNIAALGQFTTNLIPSGTIDVGTTSAPWRTIHANNISGAIYATNGVVSGSSQIINALPNGSVSGSSQVNFTQLAGISSNIVSASSDTANIDITISNGSISANIYGGVFSGSAQVVDILSSINAYTSSNDDTNTNQNNRLNRLEESTASINLTTASLNVHVADINLKTGSFETKFTTIGSVTASLNSFTQSVNGHLIDINAFTASQNSKDEIIANLTSSYNQFTASANSRLNEIESYTSSLKNAIGLDGQNVTIQGNLTVAGTTTAVNSTTIQLGDNIIELNGTAAANGGLYVKDPTAPNIATGSIIWDSTLDYWKAGIKNEESKILLANGDSIVSSSAQVVNILNSLNVFTQSQDLKNTTIASYTSSMNNHTASINGHITDINLKTGSFENKFDSIAASTSSLNNFSASTLNRFNRIEESTSSLNQFSASENTKSETLRLYTASIDAKFTTLQTYTSSIDLRIERLKESTASLNLYTSSNDDTNTNQNNRLNRLEESTASLNTFSASINVHVTNINNYTASIFANLADINAFTSSQQQKDTTLENVTASLNLQTASFNTFTGSVFQPFSNSVDSRLDSLEYTVTILTPAGLEESLILINLATQSLQAFSQSIHQYTASLDNTIARLKESTASINLTTASLNEFTNSINNRVNSLASLTSSYLTSLNGAISSSAQVLGGTGIISSSAQIDSLFNLDGIVSGSSQINFLGLNEIPNGIISSSTQLPAGTVSGSSQVYSGVSGDITIAANGVATIANNSVLLGTDTIGDYVANLVVGTGVTITDNIGEGSTPTIAIGQAVGTSSDVQFGSLGIGMAASGTTGRIDAINDIVAFSSSDKRFKDNIKPIENALEKIQSVGGYEFDWKEENKIEHGYDGHDIGVIAQEIEAIAPELVQTRENGYKAVKYEKIVPLLIEAIKELSAKLKEMEKK
jgi:hypothetical protein